MEIKLTKKPEEVYWKTTTEYELEVSGNPITIRIEEDSNGIEIWYRDGDDEKWALDRPDWIIALDENGVLGQYRDQFEVGKVINTEEGQSIVTATESSNAT